MTGGGEGRDELEFFTPRGEVIRLAAEFGQDRHVPGREPVSARYVAMGEGWRVLQYRLPLPARKDHRARDALEREARAALAIERAYGSEVYADVFTRLVGHNLDASEPFLLYAAAPATGTEPLARHTGRLSVEQLRAVMGQLTLAVHLLSNIGFVHRALTPDTVLWDGKKVRVGEPHAAVHTGAPREAFGQAPWAAPEQRRGTGAADSRDDVWSVAQVTYHLLAGRPGDGAGPPSDLDGYRQLAAFRDSGAFAAGAEGRSHAIDVLRLLNRSDPLGGVSRPADPLDAGREEFDRLLAAKRRDLGHGPEGGQDGEDGRTEAGDGREGAGERRDAAGPRPGARNGRPVRRGLWSRRSGGRTEGER
ncbi:hypothetical protein [Streptomyces sp. ODS28]|uniref:hypothetical protein n=1 Tax=Streptomyces sp. ODS28 TaxID=3136688 RepID=UPI0031EC3C76